MPPRLTSLFLSTATVLSPDGLGIAGSPAVSVSGVKTRPTPKPGAQNSSSAPPGTRSCLYVGGAAAAAAADTARSRIAVETWRATDKGHLRITVVWGGNNDRCHRANTKRALAARVSSSTLAKYTPAGAARPSRLRPAHSAE